MEVFGMLPKLGDNPFQIYNYPISSYVNHFFSWTALILSWVQMEPKRDVLYQKNKYAEEFYSLVFARTFANLDIDKQIMEHQEQRNQTKSKLMTRLD